MIKLIFHYKDQKNTLFKFFISADDMYAFIKTEDIIVEKVEEIY
jgi:hypothetical protein